MSNLAFDCEHIHRPCDFKRAVSSRFACGNALVMICATGIAVRVLSPLIDHKSKDPAVIVIDDMGSYVVPLLGLHAQNAIHLGKDIADVLCAHCVITSARAEHSCYISVGVGCERNIKTKQLIAAVESSLIEAKVEAAQISCMASIDVKSDQKELRELAQHFSVELHFFSSIQLARYHPFISEFSQVVFKAVGCYAVSETAALCAAHRLSFTQPELLLRKKVYQQVTCAIAQAPKLQHKEQG